MDGRLVDGWMDGEDRWKDSDGYLVPLWLFRETSRPRASAAWAGLGLAVAN